MRDVDLDPVLLRCFLAVIDSEGFTSAGHRLGCTQSAVSVKIQKLEAMLGQRLFERTSRSLALSPHGAALVPYARRLLALNDETVKRLRAPEIEGRLRIGIVEYLAPDELPVLLAELARGHPRIRLEVRLGLSQDLLAGLDADQLDIVVAKPDHPDRKCRPLLQERLLWVTGRGLRFEPDASIPLLLMPAPCAYRAAATDALAAIGRHWHEALTTTSIRGVQAAVKAGLGLSVLGGSSLSEDIEVLGADDGLPQLPSLDIAIFGGNPATVGLLRHALHKLIRI